MERDHGVGYTRCSIRSMADRSLSVSRRMSTRTRCASIIVERLLCVGDAQVDGLGRLGGAEVACEGGVVAGPRNVALVVVRRDDAVPGFDLGAEADGAVADVGGPPCDFEPFGGEATRLAGHEREDLLALPVDQGHRARSARGEGVQRGDAGDGDVEGEGQRAGSDEAHAEARVAPRARADRDPLHLARFEARGLEQLLDVLEHPDRARGALAEDIPIAREGDRRHVRGSVKREDQHL